MSRGQQLRQVPMAQDVEDEERRGDLAVEGGSPVAVGRHEPERVAQRHRSLLPLWG